MYATVMVCWLTIGCLMATSQNNPFSDQEACEAEVSRMQEALSTPPWFPYGPPNELNAKCLSQEELDHMLEVKNNVGVQ